MSDGWAEFWQAGVGACLPKAGGGTAGLLARCWQDFAAALPRKAELLDLATGDGAVLKTIRAARADLRLIGVDSAPRLPAAPQGIKLLAAVRMEALPFPAGRFAAVTSQFGFEYGETGAIAREVARVLAPSGRYRFVVHHHSSQVLAHNQARRAGLRWAVEDSQLLQQARALVHARSRAALPTPERFRQAPAQARQLAAGAGVAAEIATAVLQTLEMGRARAPELSLGALAISNERRALRLPGSRLSQRLLGTKPRSPGSSRSCGRPASTCRPAPSFAKRPARRRSPGCYPAVLPDPLPSRNHPVIANRPAGANGGT
jgi:ubiquinone/menaquinone biosynthesis C-methylase UbiE